MALLGDPYNRKSLTNKLNPRPASKAARAIIIKNLVIPSLEPVKINKNRTDTTAISINTRVLSRWEKENIIIRLMIKIQRFIINKSKIFTF